MTFEQLVQIVPSVSQLVVQIERPGYGKLKRETVIDIVCEALQACNTEPPQKYIEIVVDDLVRFFNEAGQFQHTIKVEAQSA